MAPPRISESQAIDLARRYAESKNWPWHGESVFAWLNGAWYITTRPDTAWIANLHVTIHPESGDVIDASFRPDAVNPISRREALGIARKCIQDNGWAWREVYVCKDELDVESGNRMNCWTIGTNRDRIGGNATIIVEAETGRVLEASFINR